MPDLQSAATTMIASVDLFSLLGGIAMKPHPPYSYSYCFAVHGALVRRRVGGLVVILLSSLLNDRSEFFLLSAHE
jgi:hypothetical protein